MKMPTSPAPTSKTEDKDNPVYWSVLHHKNVNAHDQDPNADVGIPRVIRHEKAPLVKESSTKSDITEVEYGSAAGDEEKRHRRKWSRVRELVKTNELVSKYNINITVADTYRNFHSLVFCNFDILVCSLHARK